MSHDTAGAADHAPGSAGGVGDAQRRGGFRAEVSLDRCTGTGRCVLTAPAACRFTDALVSEFDPHGAWTRAQVRAAADSCPMSAITVIEDEQGPARPAGRTAP